MRPRLARIRLHDIEAMQHDGTPETARTIDEWIGKPAPECTPGSWVVKYPGLNVVRVYTDEIFRDIFEIISETA